MGAKERRERERMERRRAILDAARVLVREHGFNRTTTRMMADRCELSEATLFFYFSSKDEILTSLLLEGAE
ncbi:MAG: helix-turn-helix domain-containing protein, partial [Acidimicrobiia bacterium]